MSIVFIPPFLYTVERMGLFGWQPGQQCGYGERSGKVKKYIN